MSIASLLKAAAMAAFFLTIIGCDRDASVVDMRVIPGPPGSALLTMDVVAVGETQLLLAPTTQQLLVRDKDKWQSVDSQLLPSFQLAPFQSLQSIMRSAPFPRSRSFCAADGRVWFLGKPDAQQPPQLWMSLDGGRTFNPMELPNPQVAKAGTEIRATDPFWLRCMDSQVYLLHSRDVWRFDADSVVQWLPTNFDGVDFEAADGLPPVIRSYLPKNQVRPFELLTLLADQLYVWRRPDLESPWILTSTFNTAERDLIGSPTSSRLWLVTPAAIYQSDDQGEQWYRMSPPELDSIETVRAFEGDDGDTILLAGSTNGSIWKYDGQWSSPRPPDIDQRSVVAFVRRGEVIWAAVQGQGALMSTDLGNTWQEANEGAQNTLVHDLAFTPNSVVLATSAGAYERSLETKNATWNRLHNRAATSVHSTSGGRIIVGTRSGDLVFGNRVDPTTVSIEPSKDAPEFELMEGQEDLPASAVVGIRSVGEYAIALTHRNGSAFSLDGGNTWQPLDFASALISTLSASTITRFMLGTEGKSLFLAERSLRRGTPTQMWRSEDNGASWTAITGLTSEEQKQDNGLWMRWSAPGEPPILVARNSQVARSMDGEQWEVLDGPWRSSQVVGMDVAQGHAVILAEAGARHVLFYMESVLDPTQAERVLVSWPPNEGIGRIRTVRMHRRKIYVLTDSALLEGTLPLGGKYGSSLTSTLTASLIVVATFLGFVILKRYGR